MLNNKVSLLDLVNTVDTEISNIIYRTANVIKQGNVSDMNGNLSNFSSSNYGRLPLTFRPGSKAWEIGMKVKLNNMSTFNPGISRLIGDAIDKESLAILFHNYDSNHVVIFTYVSSNNGNWDVVCEQSTSAIEFTPGLTVWYKLVYDTTKYSFYISLDGKNYTKSWDVNNSTPIYQSSNLLCLGASSFDIFGNNPMPLNGEIDLNECYINIDGERFWTGVTSVSSNELANINLSNLSNDGKVYASSLSLPSNRFDDLTLGANHSQYIAPANGWFLLQMRAASSSSSMTNTRYIVLHNITTGVQQEQNATYYNNCLSLMIPARKEDVVSVGYDCTGSVNNFRFYYLEGNK